ncbi:MAG TPA: peroxiredoxin [Gemmatimonadales bacterium]|nr:peroxiredoxin [Gemmatimonadales bacterium]
MTLRPLHWTLGLALAVAGCAPPTSGDDGALRPAAFIVGGPETGQRAPIFTLPGATREGALAAPWDLSLQRGRVTVIAFYPGDFTSGCTAEWQTFAQRGEELFGGDVAVVGISADTVASHVAFAQQLGLPYTLLSDPDLRVARLYGSAGDQGRARRTVYVLDRDGKVTYRDLHFGALDPKSYDALQQAVAALR